jgi:pimeloyl-ACP methyl ester carboxylesterase
MQSVDITFRSGATTLAGSLITPSGAVERPAPVVLLVGGSGPIDRNSNMKKLAIGVMAQVADHLGRAGLASLRYDKRGIGASGGDYLSAGLHDNVDDARAAIETLRARPEVDSEKVFVVGHSEGAVVAVELAAADHALAGVVLLAGTASTGEEVLRWQAEQVSRTLPRPVKLLLRVLRQDVVRTQAKRLEQIRRTTSDTARVQMVKINAKWFREFMAHDPAPSLRSIRTPVLALAGSKDIQVDPSEVDHICRLVPSECSGRVIEDLTHLLRTEAGPPSVRTYKKQAGRPIAPEVLSITTTWLDEHAATPNEDQQR